MVELSAENKKMFFVPEGFAHGYLVTSQESIVLYKCTNIYNAKDEYGIRWDDATIGIAWGKNTPILSERDKNLPTLNEARANIVGILNASASKLVSILLARSEKMSNLPPENSETQPKE